MTLTTFFFFRNFFQQHRKILMHFIGELYLPKLIIFHYYQSYPYWKIFWKVFYYLSLKNHLIILQVNLIFFLGTLVSLFVLRNFLICVTTFLYLVHFMVWSRVHLYLHYNILCYLWKPLGLYLTYQVSHSLVASTEKTWHKRTYICLVKKSWCL